MYNEVYSLLEQELLFQAKGGDEPTKNPLNLGEDVVK